MARVWGGEFRRTELGISTAPGASWGHPQGPRKGMVGFAMFHQVSWVGNTCHPAPPHTQGMLGHVAKTGS